MVILKKLYSEKGLFNSVTFQPGINIIEGVYTKSVKDLNGIGKSTLVRLINFALLSDSTANQFFNIKRYEFLKGHSIILEFEADGKSHFIKRAFDEPTKPQFGTDISSLQTYEESELKTILGNLFFGRNSYSGYFESIWFRSLIKFFIKDDVDHFERKDPLNFIHKNKGLFEIYSYNLFLLDLPNKSVATFDELKWKMKELRNQRKRIISRLEEDAGKKIEEINSEITQLDHKIKSFEKSINEYKFLETYKDVEKELIIVSNEISSLLKKLMFLQRKLNEYKKSYEFEVEVDKDQVAKLYDEVKDVFGGIIKKNLDEVILFRKKLAENRELFLRDKELELKSEIDSIRSKISSLEEQRSALYKILDEKKALDSIKNTYLLLIEDKTKKERLLASISDVKQVDEDIYRKNNEITKTMSAISEEIHSVQEKINKISSLFFEIVKETIHVDDIRESVFDIRPQPNINSPLKISIDVPKSNALGKARFKILAYDLTAFLNIIESKRKLPHFLIHDGVFHGIDIKVLIRILNFIYSKYLQFPNFQYIITANENEISIPEDKKDIYGNYNFNLSECIIATYKDIPEEMIFKREY